jgi:hypothetical protein
MPSCYKRRMREEARCLGCNRWFWFEVAKEDYSSRVLDYLPAWCIDCGKIFEELDFELPSVLREEREG